jgi:hypothetical protein
MNRRNAQLLLLAIMVPTVLAVAYSVHWIWNGYRPSLELILGVGRSVHRSLPGYIDREQTQQGETLTSTANYPAKKGDDTLVLGS